MLELVDPVITGTLSNTQSVSGSLSGEHGVSGVITVGGSSDWPEYDGSYSITPGAEAQILETAYKVSIENIVRKYRYRSDPEQLWINYLERQCPDRFIEEENTWHKML